MSDTSYRPNPNNAVFDMPMGIMCRERRYDPIANANDSAFRQDSAYFKIRKDRFLAIRKAVLGEFDNIDANLWLDGHYVSLPIAWVRVTRHPTLGMRSVVVW